jgi:hypothetical protein
MTKPLEAAAKAEALFDGRTWLSMPKADRERYVSRAKMAQNAYLRALAEKGPSNAVLDAGLECQDWSPSQIWPAMIAAHIKELEDGK